MPCMQVEDAEIFIKQRILKGIEEKQISHQVIATPCRRPGNLWCAAHALIACSRMGISADGS